MAHLREFTLAHVAYVQVRLLALSDLFLDMTVRLPTGSLFSLSGYDVKVGMGLRDRSGASVSDLRPPQKPSAFA